MCSESKLSIDVDTMLWHTGDFGKYQYILMILFSIINALSAFHYFGQTFISVVPEYECKTPEYKNVTISVKSSECSFTVHNASGNFDRPCTSGWKYNNSYGYISMVEQLNWVCDDDWKPAVGQSVFFIGSVVGTLGFGIMADHIGRLHVLVMANILALIGNLSTVLTNNVLIFGVSRFMAGTATDSNFVMMYIIVMEYIRPSMRTFALNLCIGVFYCVSCIAVPWVAVILGTWRYFLLVVSLPHICVLSFYIIVPESAQWLISKGRTEEAIHCFERIAKINNKKIENDVIEGLRYYSEHHVVKTSHESFWGLLKTPRLRRKTCILVFKSMVMTLGYDAISRNINGFGYSPFIIFSITSVTIFPACVLILAMQDKIGRKALASGSLFLSGIFTAGSGIILSAHTGYNVITIAILAIIARLGITVAYNSGAQYAMELIPTVVRGQGVSAVHVCGYAASFFSPHILYLGNFWKPFPEFILGVLLICGGAACLFLPETLNRTLPVTLEDGEAFGEDERIFEFACCQKSHTESTLTLAPEQYTQYS